MASVLHSTLPLRHHNTSPSSKPTSVSTLSACNFSTTQKIHNFSTLQRKNYLNNLKKRLFICLSSSSEVTFIEPPDSAQSKDGLIGSLKIKLLSTVSGLNRGLAASEGDLRKAEAAAKELESFGGAVDLTIDIEKLQGKWKLIHSSAFSYMSLGGRRLGPLIGRLLPVTPGQVFQRIDVFSKDFDNIVELELGAPWPFPPIEVTATLAHKFEIIGTSGVKIMFDKTTLKTAGNLSQLRPFDVPRIPHGLRPPSDTESGEFEVTYLDSDMRITRGDKGELRVFVVA